jgi:PAS domain S-box-containing protein
VRAERHRSVEQLFEDSIDPAFIIAPAEDRIVAVNHAGCAMLGYTHDEMLATPVSHVHPAELPQFHGFLRSVLRDGRGSRINLTCRTKDGRCLPTEMSLHAFAEGEHTYILGLVQDRSEHRQPDPGD